MSDWMTTAQSPDGEGGLSEWGRLTRTEAIARARRYWEFERDLALRLLALPDDEWIVKQHRGVNVWRNVTELASGGAS